MSNRAYYSANIIDFLSTSSNAIIGKLTSHHSQDLVHLQTNVWKKQIEILQSSFKALNTGHVFFEMLIPRMGKRADVVYIANDVIFVLEFKVGETRYNAHDLRQTEGYAMDLSCFHETSHDKLICPILVATNAPDEVFQIEKTANGVLPTIKANASNLGQTLNIILETFNTQNTIDPIKWMDGRYKPDVPPT